MTGIKFIYSFIEKQVSKFNVDQRKTLYSNIYKSLANSKQLHKTFEKLAEAATISKDRRLADSYSKMGKISRRTSKSGSVASAIQGVCPKSETEIINKADKSGNLMAVLLYIGDIAEINGTLKKGIIGLFFVLLEPVLLLSIYSYFLEYIILNFVQSNKLYGSIPSLLISWSKHFQSYWYIYYLSFFSYVSFFYYYRNSRPNKIRNVLDYFPFFKTYKEIIAAQTLVTIGIELQLQRGESDGKMLRELASLSSPWVSGHLMLIVGKTKRLTTSKALFSSDFFPPKLRGRIAEISAVESNQLGLVDAALSSSKTYSLDILKKVGFYKILSELIFLAAITPTFIAMM